MWLTVVWPNCSIDKALGLPSKGPRCQTKLHHSLVVWLWKNSLLLLTSVPMSKTGLIVTLQSLNDITGTLCVSWATLVKLDLGCIVCQMLRGSSETHLEPDTDYGPKASDGTIWWQQPELQAQHSMSLANSPPFLCWKLLTCLTVLWWQIHCYKKREVFRFIKAPDKCCQLLDIL